MSEYPLGMVARALATALALGCAGSAAPVPANPDTTMNMMSRNIRSGAASLHCELVGAGPTLVFLHAGVADRRSWHGVMEALASRYLSVAYDRRGFGETTYQAESYSHVDDLLAVLDALVDDGMASNQVVLIGNSQGGRVAIDFALAHPQRVRALFLVAPAVSGEPDPDTLPDAVKRLDEAIEAAAAAGDRDLVNRLEAHLWLDGPRSPEGRVGGSARSLFLDMNGRALQAPSPGDEQAPPSAFERLGELAMPVHVVAGDLDLALFTASARTLASRVQQGTMTILPGVAHLPQLEEPQAFARELEQFLQKLAY